MRHKAGIDSLVALMNRCKLTLIGGLKDAYLINRFHQIIVRSMVIIHEVWTFFSYISIVLDSVILFTPTPSYFRFR